MSDPAGGQSPGQWRRCGTSGLSLPAISLGLWQNFGDVDPVETGREIVRLAFERGVTHFDLANNYGPPPGSAEAAFGRMLRGDLAPFRDQLIITTKAGYRMWPGPYGDGGSRKYLLASLDASLRRLGLDYVDIFYHHRPDPATPLEETAGALAHAVRSGRALYVGISNYPLAAAQEMAGLLEALGAPCVIHQGRYSLLDRTAENGLLDGLAAAGIGFAAFSPLAQGLLSGKYRQADVPAEARMARGTTLPPERLTQPVRSLLETLAAVADGRGLSLVQVALLWVLRHRAVTTAIVGARTREQLDELLAVTEAAPLSQDELRTIEDAHFGACPVELKNRG